MTLKGKKTEFIYLFNTKYKVLARSPHAFVGFLLLLWFPPPSNKTCTIGLVHSSVPLTMLLAKIWSWSLCVRMQPTAPSGWVKC